MREVSPAFLAEGFLFVFGVRSPSASFGGSGIGCASAMGGSGSSMFGACGSVSSAFSVTGRTSASATLLI